MKTRLLCLALLAASLLPAQTFLSPQGDWPLCNLGIQMSGCVADGPALYILITDSSLPWTITATLESGQIVTEHGVGQAFSLDFGGIVTNWTIAFKRRPAKR